MKKKFFFGMVSTFFFPNCSTGITFSIYFITNFILGYFDAFETEMDLKKFWPVNIDQNCGLKGFCHFTI